MAEILARWDSQGVVAGRYHIEKRELLIVLTNRLFWRSWAQALEKAGDWK